MFADKAVERLSNMKQQKNIQQKDWRIIIFLCKRLISTGNKWKMIYYGAKKENTMANLLINFFIKLLEHMILAKVDEL